MRLTRRDALAALAGAGIVGGGAAATLARDGRDTDVPERVFDESTVRTLVRAAEVLYPSGLDGTDAFVRTYAEGKGAERPEFRSGVAEATATLQSYADTWENAAFGGLDVPVRDDLLHRMGIHTADPVADGTDPERVRFYVVNELLYALYTSPTGGELVGIENPQGHPGGTESYQRGPGQPDGRNRVDGTEADR